MKATVPTIEDIYDYYHSQKTFVTRGFYPKRVKDFTNAFSNGGKEHLLKFQNMIIRNLDQVDWRIYIQACAKSLGKRFSLDILGTPAGTRLYRNYILINQQNPERTVDDIISQIRDSIQFLKMFFHQNGITWVEYMSDNGVVPTFMRHLKAGSVSLYFYACFTRVKIHKYFKDVQDDVFYELFHVNRDDFIEFFIQKRHRSMIVNERLLDVINKVDGKFE